MMESYFANKLNWGLGTGDWGLGTGDWGLGTRDWGLGTGDLGLVIPLVSLVSLVPLVPLVSLFPIPYTFEEKIHGAAHVCFYWLGCGFEDQCII
ncbi:hypothetical protein NSTC731_03239 [Nostoc sp. DSM 114167]